MKRFSRSVVDSHERLKNPLTLELRATVGRCFFFFSYPCPVFPVPQQTIKSRALLSFKTVSDSEDRDSPERTGFPRSFSLRFAIPTLRLFFREVEELSLGSRKTEFGTRLSFVRAAFAIFRYRDEKWKKFSRFWKPMYRSFPRFLEPVTFAELDKNVHRVERKILRESQWLYRNRSE